MFNFKWLKKLVNSVRTIYIKVFELLLYAYNIFEILMHSNYWCSNYFQCSQKFEIFISEDLIEVRIYVLTNSL